ncbi:MAG: M20/M25/M40 family metallo-hydrolase [Anaerolineales bacterium]|nr:M20/M25/M40 family metallo-hydrolase [Anaerolineales bacterium]
MKHIVQVNKQRLVSLTQQLVRINSEYSEGIVCNHDEIAIFLRDYSKSIGLEVHWNEPEKGYPYIIARRPGKAGKPVLAFIGHYNTHTIGDRSKWMVDPLGGEIKNGYIYGRGITDMKKNIAAAIEATQAVMESGVQLQGDIVHIWFAGEGYHDTALEQIVNDSQGFGIADWYIDGDGAEGTIAKIAGSWVWVKIRTRGKTGHSAMLRGDGSKPINAISKMAKLITEMEKVDDWMSYKEHDLFNTTWRYSTKPIVEANIISGGDKVNEVAGECNALVDFRLLPGQTPELLMEELDLFVKKLQAEDDDFFPVDVEIYKATHSHPWELTEEHPVVDAIYKAAVPVIGRKPAWQGLVFGSRPALWQIGEVIHFGLAGGRDYHGFDESTSLDELVKGSQIYANVIQHLLS